MIDKHEFERRCLKIHEHFGKLDINASSKLNYSYMMVSTSLGNFLFSMDSKTHLPIYKEILINQELAEAEQYVEDFWEMVRTEYCEGLNISDLVSDPGIICTFHTGSYRLIGQYLAYMNVPYTLLVSGDVSERENRITSFLREQRDMDDGRVEVIDLKAGNMLFSLAGVLKRNRNLLVYIDGNMGTGSEMHNMVSIPFLDMAMRVRTGIANLGYLYKKKLYPVIADRIDIGKSVLKFLAPIRFEGGSGNRKSFALQATRSLYRILEEQVRKDPSQWEGWLSIYDYADFDTCGSSIGPGQIDSPYNGDLFCFNDKEYALFSPVTGPYLLEKKGYNIYELDKKTHELLLELRNKPISRDRINNDRRFLQLMEKGVLKGMLNQIPGYVNL